MQQSLLVRAIVILSALTPSALVVSNANVIQPAFSEENNGPLQTPKEIPAGLVKCRDNFLDLSLRLRSIPEKQIAQVIESDPKLKSKLENCWPKSEEEAEFYHGIDFIGRHLGWVVGWHGRILHTKDGGATWHKQASPTDQPLRAVDFINENFGWAAGYNGILLRTEDGGLTWEERAAPGRPRHFYTISCVRSGGCWLAGDQPSRITFGNQMIYTKLAGNKNWIGQRTPAKGVIRSIYFIDDVTGWAVSAKGEIITTLDGGKHWKLAKRRAKNFLWSIFFVDHAHGWIVGDKALVLYSSDGGKSWADQRPNVQLPKTLAQPDARLHVVRFATPKLGWAAGIKGLILNTKDGGATWTTQDYMADNNFTIYAMHMHDARLGWAAGNFGLGIAATIDGEGWFPVFGSLSKWTNAIAPAIRKMGQIKSTPRQETLADEKRECAQAEKLDRRIEACTHLLDPGRLSENDRASAYVARGTAYDEKGDHDRAIEDYNKALKIIPRYPSAFFNRGNAHYWKKEYDNAIANYDRAIKLSPRVAVYYMNRGNAYDAKGRYGRALSDLDRAIELDPQYALAYNNRGNTYRRKGDAHRAEMDYRSALKLDASLKEARDSLIEMGLKP